MRYSLRGFTLLAFLPLFTVLGDEAPSTGESAIEPPKKLDITPAEILDTKIHDLGERNVIEQRITPRTLPAPPLPLPPADISDPAVQARLAEMRAQWQETEICFVSATTYDHQNTFVRWWPNGRVDQAMSAWVNMDFNHLTGRSDFTYNGRRFSLLLGIGNVDTSLMTALFARHGLSYPPPEIPAMPEAEPAVVVSGEGTSPPGSMDLIEGILNLYSTEGEQMKLAYEQRVQAEAERKALLLANPPQPQDIVIRHWRVGGKPVGTRTGEGQ